MRRSPFYVRCYAKQTGGVWVAVCVDLCLAAQAETEPPRESRRLVGVSHAASASSRVC